jgi:hypothetical protein
MESIVIIKMSGCGEEEVLTSVRNQLNAVATKRLLVKEFVQEPFVSHYIPEQL